MVLGPYQSYCYYRWDSGYTSSTTMGANTATNMHLPYNPIIGKFNPPEVELEVKEEVFFSDEENSLAYTGENKPVDTGNEAVYRGPLFMLNSVFSHTSIDSAWSGSSKTMTGDFTSHSHITTLTVQNHVHDQGGSSHVENCHYGTKVVEYYWKGERGGVLKEGWNWNCRGVNTTAQAADMTTGYHDSKFNRSGVTGGFDNWDGSFVKGIKVHNTTLTLGGSAISHVNVENYKLGVKLPVEHLYDYGSVDAMDVSYQPREYYLEVEGTIKGKNQYTEIRNAMSSRTRRDAKITIKTNNYLQFTNAVLVKIDPAAIPKAGDPLRVKLYYKGLAGTSGTNPTMSYYGLFSNVSTDPDNALYNG